MSGSMSASSKAAWQKSQPCAYEHKPSGCRFSAADCKFRHTDAGGSAPGVSRGAKPKSSGASGASLKSTPCPFERKGACRYSAACKHAHAGVFGMGSLADALNDLPGDAPMRVLDP